VVVVGRGVVVVEVWAEHPVSATAATARTGARWRERIMGVFI
jgi:hypothetical protein